MKLACQEGMTPGRNLEEKLAHLEEYGYEGIEFSGGRVKNFEEILFRFS